MAVPAAVRQPRGVRPDPRPRGRALADQALRPVPQRAALPAGDAGDRDHVRDRDGQRQAHRRDGLCRRPARPRARSRRSTPLVALGRGRDRRGGAPARPGAAPRVRAVAAGGATAIDDSTMSATFTVSAGERVGFALQWVPPEGPAPEPFAPDRVAARIEDTIEAWRSWE